MQEQEASDGGAGAGWAPGGHQGDGVASDSSRHGSQNATGRKACACHAGAAAEVQDNQGGVPGHPL